jgi:3-isopropylmalate/(R)-2-methylmalate dehydratase large subunit
MEVSGKLPRMVSAKDVILRLVGNVGADGATYMACEFSGSTVSEMEIPARMTMCNMAIEMGGKSGIVEPDKKTSKYLEEIGKSSNIDEELKSDHDAVFDEVIELDAGDLSPQVARPHCVDDVVDVDEVEGTKIDQVFLGSCTNGRFPDITAASNIIKGEKIADDVRMLVIPASKTEYLKCLDAGHIETLVRAGALVEAPCCGPCMGGSFGLLGSGEVSLSTSNRNFQGRQGSPQASVYLCSPETAAASALQGVITDPREA